MAWIVEYMAKFGVPWFPETKASLWQILILWQSRPCIVCASNIGSLGQRALWYAQVTYPLLWNEYVYGSLGCLGYRNTLCCGMTSGVFGQVCGALVPRNEGVPLADYDFMAVLAPAISAPWVKGLFGTHRLHTLCCGMTGVFGQVCGASQKRRRVFASNIGSLGQRANWYTQVAYPLLWKE